MKVSESVHCRIGKDGGSNNGFIVCDDCCVVVDTATYPDQTRKDLEALRQATDKEIRFLINTHYHGDHTFGNMYFSDIIAHKHCREKLKEQIPFYTEYIQKMEDTEREKFEGFHINLPNIVFSRELSLLKTPEIVITRHGGHTRGSTTVYIPKEKVLFAGDLLFAGYHPYLADADIQEWIKALKDLLELDVEKIVPGHGLLCDMKEVKTHIRYLETFYSNLKDLKKKYSREEILENVDMLDLPEMGDEERITRNVEEQYDKVS